MSDAVIDQPSLDQAPEEPKIDDLGAPDLSSFIDDDEPEIVYDAPQQGAKAQNSLKAGEMITMVAGMMCNFVASRKGEHWKLQPEEAHELAIATNDCLDEYFPDFECSPGWVLAGVSAGILAPRVMIDAQNAAKAKAAEGGEHEQPTE